MMMTSARPLPLVLGCALLVAGCGDSDTATRCGEWISGAATVKQAAASASTSASPVASTVPVGPTAEPTPSTFASAAPSASAPLADGGAPRVFKRPLELRTPVAVDAGAPPAAGAVTVTDAGAPSPAAQIARQIDGIFNAKKTFTARFQQHYTLKVTGVVKDSSGVVFVEKPNKISFRYDPPSKNRIVSDGTTIKVYTAEDQQMLEIPVGKTQYPGALGFMMGNGISSSFTFGISPNAKFSGVVLDGKPREPNPSYERVLFFIDQVLLAKGEPGAMNGVLLLDAAGNRNRFEFQGASQPASIDPGEFVFSPPPGTNVLKQ